MEAGTVEQFVDECCTQGPRSKEATLLLWDAYIRWCNDDPSLPADQFLQQLRQLGFKLAKEYVIGLSLNVNAPMRLDVEDVTPSAGVEDDKGRLSLSATIEDATLL